MSAQKTGPLADVIVLDLSRALAGPHAAMMLGDLGARVIKVEHPAGGDDSRAWGPPFMGPPDNPVSTYFLSCNRNKESVTADLKSDDGRDLLTRLVARADVLVENFRAGVLDRLGFSPARLHEINPGLVLLSITGFGHDGPEGQRAGYDQIAQGEAGIMALTGPDPDHPMRTGLPVGDLLAGMYGAYGVLAALHERERTGKGKVVRTSLLAAIVGTHAFQGTRYTVGGDLPRAEGNHHPSISPYGAFACADGFVQIAVGNDAIWARFAPLVAIDPTESRFGTNPDRVANRPALTAAIERAFATQTQDELLSRFAAAGVPGGAIRQLDQVYGWEQTRSQGLLIEVEHDVLGPVTVPGPALRLFEPDTAAEWHHDHAAAPSLGADNVAVLAWLDS